jgi:hypothetical protein
MTVLLCVRINWASAATMPVSAHALASASVIWFVGERASA